MKRTDHKSGEIAIQETFNYNNNSLSDGTKERKRDLFLLGILKNSQQNSETYEFRLEINALKINILTGIAYDNLGERLDINLIGAAKIYDVNAPDNTTDNGLGTPIDTPQSTGSFNIDYSGEADDDYYVWIRYLDVINNTSDPGTFSLHKVTNAKLFTQHEDGFIVYPFHTSSTVQPTEINPAAPGNAVYLGKVTKAGALLTVDAVINRIFSKSINQRIGIELDNTKKPATYTNGEEKFLDDHMNSVGGGTTTPSNPHGLNPEDIGVTEPDNALYQQETHANGIVSYDPTNDSSNLFPEYIGSVMHVKKLADTIAGYPKESVYIDGLRFDKDIFTAEFVKDYGQAGEGLTTGDYWLYIDSLTSNIIYTTTPFVQWTEVQKRSRFVLCYFHYTFLAPTDEIDDLVDMRRFLQPVGAPSRTYTGMADIDKNVQENLYIHIEQGHRRAILHLWAEKFNTQFYTELGLHAHGIATNGVVNGGHSHSHAFGYGGHAGSQWLGNNSTSAGIYISSGNLVFHSHLSTSPDTNPGTEIKFETNTTAVGTESGFDTITINSGGVSSHTFTNPTYVSRGTPSSPTMNESGIKEYIDTLKIYINGEDKTFAITGSSSLSASSDTKLIDGIDIMAEIKDVVDAILNGKYLIGEHKIEIVETSSNDNAGGRIRYSLYLE